MPIGDLVYNSDLYNGYYGNGCECNHGDVTPDGKIADKIYVMMPPPPSKFPLYPYPPYPCPPGPPHHDEDEEGTTPAKQSSIERQICKLSKKSATLRALIENISEKNKAVIIKSAAVSYNLGQLKTKDPDDPDTTIEDEDVQAIIDILKGELEEVKAKLKDLSDQIEVEP